MVEGVFSFHSIREACLADQPAGWRHFVRNYAPLARQMLQHYFPGLDQAAVLAQVFREAKAHQAQLWRTFTGTTEKEFLLHFRRFVLAQGRATRGPAPPTPLTPESFWLVVQSFPSLQREMLLLSFRRYAPEQVSLLTKFVPESVRVAAEQAREKLKAQWGAAAGPELEKGDPDALFTALEAQRGENCLLDKSFVRLADGQITWREREAAERHLEECLSCLNRSADFHEVFHYFHAAPAAEDAVVADVLAAMGLPSQGPARRTGAWWQRLLGG